VTFGKDYDEKMFNEVLQKTGLIEDVNQFNDGIKTEIGERGVNLSGGQKARISLARAIYSNQDIYLLDDPVSAVDAHVGELIFS